MQLGSMLSATEGNRSSKLDDIYFVLQGMHKDISITANSFANSCYPASHMYPHTVLQSTLQPKQADTSRHWFPHS